jgi:hypothetical protein
VRQLAAAAGDGPLGFAGSPGQLETSLNSGYTVGPCNSYLEGPTLIFLVAARASRALRRLRRPRSPRKERLGSLLLRTAARAIADARSQVSGSFVLSGSSRIARFADARSHVAALGPLRLLKPGLTQLSGGLHMLQPVQTAKNLCIHRFLTSDEGCATTPCGRQRAAMDSKRVCALALELSAIA